MTWFPIFKIASLDFEKDIQLLKKFMNSLEKKVHFENGYKFSSEAQFAMGWWFYEIYVKIGFIKNVMEVEHASNPNIKDELDLATLVQRFLKQNGSKGRITLHTNRSIFAKYWTWLLR